MEKQQIIKNHNDWKVAASSIYELERQMLNDLCAFHDVRRGDAVENENGIRIVIQEIKLRDTVSNYTPGHPTDGLPMLILNGAIITKKNRLHARGSERGFNTSYNFTRFGRFDIGAGRFDRPRGLLLPPRECSQ